MPDGTHAQKCMQTASTRMGACTPGEYGPVKLALLCDLIGGVLTMRGTADLMMADIKAKDTGDTTGVPTARGAFSLSAIQVSLALSLSSSRSLSLALSAAAAPPPSLCMHLCAYVCMCAFARACTRVRVVMSTSRRAVHGGARTAVLVTCGFCVSFWMPGEGRWAGGCERAHTALAHGPQRT